ncbi:maleylacetate reductase [soil metagenome]
MPSPFVYETRPSRVVFGVGRRHDTPAELSLLGVSRVFLIADRAAAVAGDAVADELGRLVAHRWDDVVQHVPVEIAERARSAADAVDADVVVSIGGGSATGLAKAIALTSGRPIVAIPTTYAGSEQTAIYGLTGGRHKQTGRDPRVLPKTVVYDPELTLGLSTRVTGASACNALAHSVEALWVAEANPVTTALSLDGIRAIATALPAVMRSPRDLDSRGELLYGAYLSGVALGTTSAGMHHKITHVLGGTFGLVHADAHSVVLPHVVAFNTPAIPHVTDRLDDALGAAPGDAAGALWDLASTSGIPTSLAELGLDIDHLPEAAERAAAEITDNPRAVSVESLLELLRSAHAGRRP